MPIPEDSHLFGPVALESYKMAKRQLAREVQSSYPAAELRPAQREAFRLLSAKCAKLRLSMERLLEEDDHPFLLRFEGGVHDRQTDTVTPVVLTLPRHEVTAAILRLQDLDRRALLNVLVGHPYAEARELLQVNPEEFMGADLRELFQTEMEALQALYDRIAG